MNTNGINVGPLNSGLSVKWVISASAIALASASASADGIHICYGSAYGNAVVDVTLSGSHTISAKGTGQCSVSSNAVPTIIRSASAYTLGSASGYSSVWRTVSGHASADGSSSGVAIASDHLGEASADGSTSGLATPHIIFYGKSNVFGDAMGASEAIPIRGTTAIGVGSSFGFGEPSIKKFGENFTRLFGFSNTTATAVGSVRNDYTAIIAHYGSFLFGNSQGIANGILIYSGKSNTLSTATSSSSGTRTTFASGENYAISTSEAVDLHMRFGNVYGVAFCDVFPVTANVMYRGYASLAAQSQFNPAIGTIRHRGASVSIANAISIPPVHATHRFAIASSNSIATGSVEPPSYIFGGNATGLCVSNGFSSYSAHWLSSASVGASASGIANSELTTDGTSTGEATSYGTSVYASHHFGNASTVVSIDGISDGTVILMGHVNASAQCIGSSIGFSNADVHAPESRTMIVSQEDRIMVVSEEPRNMLVGV